MPTFNYKCKSCEHVQEEFRSFSEAAKGTKCVKCGSKSTKTFSTPAIVFDGSNPDFVAAHDRWVKEHETKGNGVRSFS